MRNQELWGVSEFRPYAKRTWGQDFDSDESAFVDAFENGEFHEEESDLAGLGGPLSDVQLASLYLPVCKAMISGSIDHREGPTLKVLMDCYSSLEKWQHRRLETPDELLGALAKVRELVFKEMLTKRNAWWIAVFYHFKILDCGVRNRMGLQSSKLRDEYHSMEGKLFDKV
jgi:hypothetical protein